jgi:hypothetical protein
MTVTSGTTPLDVDMRQHNEANYRSDDKDPQCNTTIAYAMALLITRRVTIIQFAHARFVHFPFGSRVAAEHVEPRGDPPTVTQPN